MSAPKDSPSLAPVPRIIPGFQQPSSTAPKPRKRSSKKGGAASSLGPQTTGTVETVQEDKTEGGVVTEDVGDESLIKRTNAVEQTKKRLRAQNKKLQRLDAYEAKSDINEDQRRALAGRGTIDAVVKELNELLVILQAEEAEDVEREKRVIAAEEKKHARAVEAAVTASKAESQSHLVLLFQFLRLRSLFTPNQPSSFAPPVLPPLVAEATGQEVAAVHSLFDEFSNGPLLGGHGDALEKLEKIASGSQDQVIEGVTFARILELVHGLTAPPPTAPSANGDTPLDSPVIESSSAPGPTDSVVALVDGEKEAHPAPSFLNESEIEPASPPADKVASWQDEVADNPQVAPSAPCAYCRKFSTPIPEEKHPILPLQRTLLSIQSEDSSRTKNSLSSTSRSAMSTSQEEPKKEEQVNGQAVEQKEEKPAAVDEPKEEEEKKEVKEEGEISETEAEGAKKDTEESTDAASSTTPKVEVQGEDAPLTKILEQLDQLSEKEQQVIKDNLERISEYPKELPLSQSWTLHFSDTSGASKHSSAAATKDAYTEGINPVFVATTVPGLCGQLKAFKKAVRHKRAKPTDPDGLGLNRPGMNLHFFRTGISPTWEDPYNEKGGRLTISPPAALFDPIYERLVLLLAGSSLELSTSTLLATEGPSPASKRPPTPGPLQEGMIMGVVASRRARGDRIELWVGGKQKREQTPIDWIDRLKEVLADQLEMPELRTSKYKKHF